MAGFIKLHRTLTDWEWYDDVNTKTLFIHLLLMANYKEKTWGGVLIQRGQFVTSLENLTRSGLSISQIRTSLKKLENTLEIVVKSTNKNTMITICKYESYQSFSDEVDKQIANKSQTNRKQIATTNKDNNIKKEKNIINDSFVDDIYNLYPSKCPIKNSSTGKTLKDKEKIAKLIIEHGQEKLMSIIIFYVEDCKKNNRWLKNFSSLLNNLPDINQDIKEQQYSWNWNGSGVVHKGTKAQLDFAIKKFDHEGFNFVWKKLL